MTSTNKIDLRNIVFSNQYSRVMLLDQSKPGEAPSLCISLSRDDPTGFRFNLIHFTPTYEGKAVDFQYEVDPGLLTITTQYGNLEITLEPAGDILRLRSKSGIGAQFFIQFAPHELFIDRLDGSFEVGFTSMGEFLFEVVKGQQSHDNIWLGPKMCATPTTIVWAPEAGQLEGYINWNTEFVEKKTLSDFDACVAENKAGFDNWLQKFAPVSEPYAEIRELAGYVTWICDEKPLWGIKEPTAYLSRCGAGQRGIDWLQCLYAMAAWRDPKLAFDFLHNFFALQEAHGMIPGAADDRLINYTLANAPMQGFALLWVLDHIAADQLDLAECERLYEPLCRWIGWWKENRCGSNGLMYYTRAAEPVFDAGPAFAGGVPVETPDLQAYLILCLEACGRLAKLLGKADAAAYESEANALTEKLIAELWDGDSFVCMQADGKKTTKTQSILACIPVILGDRLPKEILAKLAKQLADPRKYFTEHGFACESLDSPLLALCGGSESTYCPVAQLLITVGLSKAGEKDLAAKNAANWLDFCKAQGAPVNEMASVAGEIFPVSENVPGSFGSAGSAAFFVLSDLL